jgi:hypothetical protein
LGTTIEVVTGAFRIGRVMKLESLATGVCKIDCTDIGLMVTGAISTGVDSGAGVAKMTRGAMDEETGTETMIDIEDEYSYTAENFGLGWTCALADDTDVGTAYTRLSGIGLFIRGAEGSAMGASNSWLPSLAGLAWTG